ncbi:MAG: molybdopterin-guanine dinucleotide biosynthesis protein A [Thermoproteota archaeon]|jgi:molybdopterin-guanine dinucleotide biosynthesis protein A/molybdopterin converting factor small subunit
MQLNALILVGGKSTRMHKDKFSLSYRNKTQLAYLEDLLKPHCDDVLISCREEQELESKLKRVNDLYKSTGPTSGILSAMKSTTTIHWLVIACDLPYLEEETITELIKAHKSQKPLATCYLNPIKNWPEPLCTIYSPNAFIPLEENYKNDIFCPRKFLFQNLDSIQTLELKNSLHLNNANSPEDYEEAMTYLNQTKSEKKVTLKYFAAMRDHTDCQEEAIETSANSVHDLFKLLNEKYKFPIEQKNLRVAINEEYKEFSSPIIEGTTIVFIPPVAGG